MISESCPATARHMRGRFLTKASASVGRVKGPGTPADPGDWVAKGFWAIIDQGLFALSSFLLNFMLARWLIPQEYRAFTGVFST